MIRKIKEQKAMEERKQLTLDKEIDEGLRNWAYDVLDMYESLMTLAESLAKKYEGREGAERYTKAKQEICKCLDLGRKNLDALKDTKALYVIYNTFIEDENAWMKYLSNLANVFAYYPLDSKDVVSLIRENMMPEHEEEKASDYLDTTKSFVKEMYMKWANTILTSIRARALLCACLATLGGNDKESEQWNSWARAELDYVNIAEKNLAKIKNFETLEKIYDLFQKEEVPYIKYQNLILDYLSNDKCLVLDRMKGKSPKNGNEA